jgi:hypothetical protein
MYHVEIFSVTGQTIAEIDLEPRDYSALVMKLRDGDGFIQVHRGRAAP